MEDTVPNAETRSGWLDEITAEPWRFDFLATLRRLEGMHKEKPRIGASAALREEIVRIGQNPSMDFPASNIEQFATRADGSYQIIARFLGLMGPQGALPLAVTSEAHGWLHSSRDDAFPRFLDLINNRFLQLFFRAWSDARPIGQHERPAEDRFATYIGSMIGMGRPVYQDLDTIPDGQKLAHAGLMGAAAKSAVRLEALFAGVLGLKAEVIEFVGSWLPVDRAEQSRLGMRNSVLGADAMVGASFYSITDKITVRVTAEDLAAYERLLPAGALAAPMADLVFFYIGEALEWDVELAIRAHDVPAARLGRSGALGWTSWLAPRPAPEHAVRCDARFNIAERLRRLRSVAGTTDGAQPPHRGPLPSAPQN
ncbi:type VI secretion system baseplate subunit TssG [Ancylobacter sp. 6x-1]|uniref:Type VI secretion system baseplate subunit TssG n=1 Tax=Ancylobacter crimeensis TaxID=2579147 RepID=A0ABT0D7K0_9HYPH|nr:type VI secretion system baseplate subunit TssG [Ancylobacter crimeensis]MCK0195930.1 type VI secretion system baseplate subunit TssG [Ancylobacter crimeensis]